MTQDEIIDMARWKDIPNFPPYQVSDCGLVKNKDRLLSQSLSDGYLRVNLQINGLSRQKKVHSLVALAFIGDRPDGFHICHFDGNKKNNHLSNLRYATAFENAQDKIRHGRTSKGCKNGMNVHPEKRPKGEQHGLSVLSSKEVDEIKEELKNWKWGMGVALAKKYNVSPSTICLIRKEKVWI